MNKIMVLGTASGVGKSTIATALCRYYKNRGFKVAPFKAMNISLNSYVTEDGLEMGRAQVVQSEACELKPMAYMNPILLKPSGNNKTQVIVNGKVHCMMDSYKYKELNKELKKIVKETFDNFSKNFEVIILEGSGSCAEINLKETDIANMSMAKAADADVILVADIDRGGVFASVVGTLMLLEEEERSRVKGVIINKFRGNVDYFKEAMKQLEEIINIPVLGVLPYFKLDIEDEDSVTERIKNNSVSNLDIAVIRLPHMSNFTDFSSLERIDEVSVRYIENVDEVNNPDLIIIPGTKNTINDLRVIKQNGIFDKINELKNKGKIILGICGGYQMLGKKLKDPYHVESDLEEVEGIGLLDTETTFELEKTTTQVDAIIDKDLNGYFANLEGKKVKGYEIHMGITDRGDGIKNLCTITEKLGQKVNYTEGSVNSECNVLGTYLHGIFDDIDFTRTILNNIREMKGLERIDSKVKSFKEFKDKEYDRLADFLREHLDIDKIYQIMQEHEENNGQ